MSEVLLDSIDKVVLNRIQSGFPVEKRPFKVLADELNLSENEVIDRVKKLKENGIIRRIGANFVPEKLGFVSTLCAAYVPDDKIEFFASFVNKYSGITHNYLRDNKFNIWFTFIAESEKKIEQELENISKYTDVDNILNLPAIKLFKIRAHFKL